jgi:hypothetical protein
MIKHLKESITQLEARIPKLQASREEARAKIERMRLDLSKDIGKTRYDSILCVSFFGVVVGVVWNIIIIFWNHFLFYFISRASC